MKPLFLEASIRLECKASKKLGQAFSFKLSQITGQFDIQREIRAEGKGMLNELWENLGVFLFQVMLDHIDFFARQQACDDRDTLSKHET